MSKKNRKNHATNEGGGADEGVTPPERSELTAPVSSDAPGPEDQRQRWVKYGSNVALVTVVAIALAVLVTYLAQRSRLRMDTTEAGDNSLKPQTVEILRGLDQPVKIVSLYTETKPAGGQAQASQVDYAGRVRDLLDEYKRNSTKIDVEAIDPEANPAKVDDLIAEVTEKYGGEVKKYREFFDKWPERFKQIRALAGEEAGAVTELSQKGIQAPLLEVAQSILSRTSELEALQTVVDRRLKQRPPDYKGATEQVRGEMEEFAAVLGQIIPVFEGVPGVTPKTQPSTQPTTGPSTRPAEGAAPEAEADAARRIPPPLLEYIKQSLPRYRELKKLADDEVARIAALGELKLDELRQKLRERDALLILGPDEMRSLSFNDVWQTDPDVRQMMRGGGAEQVKPRFAGEQQITTAILGLTSKKKPRLVFVRPGGAPLTSGGSPFQRAGLLWRVAQRMRGYNFEVMEKDLSGMWAMRSQQMGMMMPPEPEPTDEQMKDAVWVVANVPSQQMGMMSQGGDVGRRLAEHLNAGGSAMVLGYPRGSDLREALGDWGVSIDPSAIIVHERLKPAESSAGDVVEEVQQTPFIFVLNQYGEHMITKPMRSLDSILIASIVVKTPGAAGAKVTPLLSPPPQADVWGETNTERLFEEAEATKDAGGTTGAPSDVLPPFVFGAASERQGKGRLVVLGSMDFLSNQAVSFPDPELARKGYGMVTRFPGNGELFANSVFWLSKMDTMIAISPSAMEVSRIKDMSEGTLGFWRWGFLVVGLPLAVVVAGAMVYMGRRD